ncbi:MAG: hypothetical protein LBP35_03605 [Candidatus Ancillula trichonymphae]|jgi:hypothetical protein|nr:hypothetical protein [Candidatus Ancillula trichonymphae]
MNELEQSQVNAPAKTTPEKPAETAAEPEPVNAYFGSCHCCECVFRGKTPLV